MNIKSDHIIAEVHFYIPYEFVTDEGVTWTTPISEYTDYVEKSIDSAFARLKSKLSTKGFRGLLVSSLSI